MFKKRHFLIVEEADVMTLLKVLDEIKRGSSLFTVYMDMEIGNCGWAEEPTKWFVHFDVTNKQWRKVIENLETQNYQIVLKWDDNNYLEKKESKTEPEKKG